MTIVFTRTQAETQRLTFLLRSLGLDAIPIHGGMSQSTRMGALGKFRARSRNILVATDVAARGLDIPSVDAVLNFDLPDDSKVRHFLFINFSLTPGLTKSQTYVHRVGRTARAGKSGRAISFVTQYDADVWQRIEFALGKQLDKMEPVKEEVRVLSDRVNEAQTVAKRELRDAQEKGSKKGGIGRGSGKDRKGHGTGHKRQGRGERDVEEG